MKDKREETASKYFQLAKSAFGEITLKTIVRDVSDDDEIVFHKMHKVIKGKVSKRLAFTLEDRYPFVKVDGVWKMSTVKMFLYMMAARSAISKFKSPAMKSLYRAIQNEQKYLDAAKELDRKLTPSGCIDYQDYQKQLSNLYSIHKHAQLSLFENVPPASNTGGN